MPDLKNSYNTDIVFKIKGAKNGYKKKFSVYIDYFIEFFDDAIKKLWNV